MRAAVIGGGVFGCAIAVDLARAGATVDLFEERTGILEGATARNQARLHSGYHYPRSDATAAAARDAAAVFAARWPSAVRRARHWYVVAPESKVTPTGYLAFLDRLGLPYEVADGTAGSLVPPPHVHTAELVVRASEAFVDVDVLRRLLWRDLRAEGVNVMLGRRVEPDSLAGYDTVVVATYGQRWPRPLRYEVCEVALMELGRYSDDSFVVVDGEFTSLDPHGRLHALYDVKHSVHHSNVGLEPDIPDEYRPLLRSCGQPMSSLSRFDAMVESASRFLWGLAPGGQHTSIYHGSMWSVRAVLPDVDATDERPTLVERDGNIIRVLSGKVCMAATVGQSILDSVFERAAA